MLAKYKGVLFDDFYKPNDGFSDWSQVCKQCAEKHGFKVSGEGVGVCGVGRCNNPADYHIDFPDGELKVMNLYEEIADFIIDHVKAYANSKVFKASAYGFQYRILDGIIYQTFRSALEDDYWDDTYIKNKVIEALRDREEVMDISSVDDMDGYTVSIYEKYFPTSKEPKEIEQKQATPDIKQALKEFNTAYHKILTAWDSVWDGTLLAKDYPFDKSFDELGISEWVNTSIENLNNPSKIAKWVMDNGYVETEVGPITESLLSIKRQEQLKEAVENGYDIADFDRWQYLQDFLFTDTEITISWKTFCAISSALWEEEIEVMELPYKLKKEET
jgi:hypothetical protein